jgi:transposase-like protein
MKPKFSKAEKEKILSHYYSNNTEVKVLAAQYGISRQTIYNWTPAEKERRYEAERKKTVNRSLHKGVRVEHLFRQ